MNSSFLSDPQPPNSNNGSGSVEAHTSENQFVIAKCRRNKDPTNSSSANQEHSDDSETEERILVVYCRSSKLGAASYTLQTGELFILDEIVDRPPDFQMFLALYRQTEPARILLDGKTQGAFVSLVKKTVFDEGASDEGRCKLIFVSAKEYSFEACKRRILSLCLPYEPTNCTEEERTIFLRTVVDFSQIQSVHALGALLRYLDFNWTNINMDMQNKPQFFSLRKISLADIVTIDEDTYKGLQIFSSVAHPSNFKKGTQGSSKEGLSLYHIFSKCSSRVGQNRMRVLLRHPSRSLPLLSRRQAVVAFFLRPQSDTIMRNICASLRFIKNVNGILAKIKALSAKPYQWKSLYNTLYNAVLICEMCENTGDSSEFLQELASCDNNKLYEMALYMNRIIDFDLSKTEDKFTVKAGVDPELDMKKQTMASLHTLMSETARVELEKLPECVQECAMLYMPHLGYLLGVRVAPGVPAQQQLLPGLRFMFQNNDYVHYKSKGCEELDVMIGDTYPEIVAHETRIMMRLTSLMMERLQALDDVIQRCAELDCLIAMAKVAKEFNYIRPTLTNDKVISIKQGQHPLHIITCENFVPNDFESNLDEGFVKILTGPNSSGKSVYMKQVGLIVYLAQIGSFVPAERATIGVVDRLHTRIHSTECVAAHMSAFLIDLRQMATILQESTARSLVIIDEFGAGSASTDGLALLAASLSSLVARESACPHVLLATHFLDISEYIIDSPIVKFYQLEHIVSEGEPVFVFRVCPGAAERSFAHSVAAASGLASHIVERATTVMECLMNNKLPPENKKIVNKLKTFTETIKTELLSDDI